MVTLEAMGSIVPELAEEAGAILKNG